MPDKTMSDTTTSDTTGFDTSGQMRALVGGRWRLEGLLGQGGMSDVYRAADEQRDGAVAVKIVRSSDPSHAQRLAQEAKALAGFDHPGLVRLLDAGVFQEQAFLVMELVEGPTLAARLRHGALASAETAELGAALADALAYVHARGIVHRDLKPGNVLLGPGARVRLADFGIARLLDASSMTVTGATLGTAAYMAPEQIDHHAVETAADIWSLGLVLLECLTGRRAFEGTPAEVIARRLARPLTLPLDLPNTWRLLLGAMLDSAPERRPAASDVAGMVAAPGFKEPWQPAADLPGTQGGEVPTPPGGAGDGTQLDRPDPTMAAPGATELRKPARRWRLLVPAAVALAAAAGVAAWALFGTGASARAPVHHAAPPPVPTSTVPSVSDAAAALTRDVQAGVTAGSVKPAAGTAILDELDRVLAAADAQDTPAESSGLGQIDAFVAEGVAGAAIAPPLAPTLTTDVATLANALGTTPTTPTTTTTAPPTTAPPPSTPSKKNPGGPAPAPSPPGGNTSGSGGGDHHH